MTQDTLWIGTRMQQDGPTFSKLKFKVHGSLLNVSCILVPIHNCLVSLLFTPPMPILHPTLFLKEIIYLFPLFFLALDGGVNYTIIFHYLAACHLHCQRSQPELKHCCLQLQVLINIWSKHQHAEAIPSLYDMCDAQSRTQNQFSTGIPHPAI